MKKQIYYSVYYSFMYNTDVELTHYDINDINGNNSIFDRKNTDDFQEVVNKFQFIETIDDLEETGKIKEDKYRAILTSSEVYQFIDECNFIDTCETAGILDEKGHIPAISFENDENESAYIGPTFSNDAENEVIEELGKYSDEHRKVVLHRIQNKFEEILNFLSNEAIEYVKEDKQLPDFMKEMYIDVQQTEINFPE